MLLIIRFDICYLHRLEERQAVAVLGWCFFCPSHPTTFFTQGLEFVAPVVVEATSFISKSTSQVYRKCRMRVGIQRATAAQLKILFRAGRKVFSDTRGSQEGFAYWFASSGF